jgi:hypothetical protein
MESPAHQEWRATQQVNWRAVCSTTLFVGSICFIMSGGSPWSTAGTMNAVMGRDVPWNFFALLVGHFIASFVYATAIAYAVYRVHWVLGIIIGAIVGVGLNLVSHEVFTALGWVMQSPELRAVFTSITFGLFGAAVYKGASVPPPLEDLDGEESPRRF